jgi:3alpha(or 20beta)-hydroxysteroid dehydrogenase
MSNPFLLTDRVAVVTGAARGIGKAIVEAFIDADARHVVAADVLEDELNALAATHERVSAAVLDITNEGGWQALIAQTVETHGAIDILVNNAGILAFNLLEETPVEDFRRLLEVNVTGTFLGMQAVTPHMKRQGRGVIINTASVSGITPNNATGAYGASKFAVRGLTRSAALELGPHGIRVNSVHPGGVNTPMTNPLGQSNDEVNERYGFVPMQRGSEPHEIANGVLYLASDAASYCNGTELVIDGGMIAGQYLPGMPGSPI